MLPYLSHEFLGCEDQLMVNQPPRLFFEETAVRVDHHRLLMFDSLVRTSFAELGSVIEEPRGD